MAIREHVIRRRVLCRLMVAGVAGVLVMCHAAVELKPAVAIARHLRVVARHALALPRKHVIRRRARRVHRMLDVLMTGVVFASIWRFMTVTHMVTRFLSAQGPVSRRS